MFEIDVPSNKRNEVRQALGLMCSNVATGYGRVKFYTIADKRYAMFKDVLASYDINMRFQERIPEYMQAIIFTIIENKGTPNVIDR